MQSALSAVYSVKIYRLSSFTCVMKVLHLYLMYCIKVTALILQIQSLLCSFVNVLHKLSM